MSYAFYCFIAIFLMFPQVVQSARSPCALRCTPKVCGSLPSFVKECLSCATLPKSCDNHFCRTYPMFCKKFGSSSSEGDGEKYRPSQLKDICLQKLFNFNKSEDYQMDPTKNRSVKNPTTQPLSITILNTVDKAFFAQTGGESVKRNMGTLVDIAAQLFCYNTTGRIQGACSKDEGEKWLKETYNIDSSAKNYSLTPNDFHLIIDTLRKNLFTNLDIPIKKVSARQGKLEYSVTVSDIGCMGETVPGMEVTAPDSPKVKTKPKGRLSFLKKPFRKKGASGSSVRSSQGASISR